MSSTNSTSVVLADAYLPSHPSAYAFMNRGCAVVRVQSTAEAGRRDCAGRGNCSSSTPDR
ncbi:hypothetical protein ABR737_05080 [Streptomyces sp. Edi2]|uniref:hypothetical protein n=1 Tax=Streptomyces sp. Edi2 TaxID=3162528 RepID=UPI0033057F9A